MDLRVCSAEGEKKRTELWHGMGTEKREPTQFAAPIPRSQFSSSFSMPSTPQTRSSMRSEPGDGRHGAWEGSVTGIKRKVCWGGEGKNGKMWEL